MAQPKRSEVSERDPIAERMWIEQLAMLLEQQGRGQLSRTSGRILALMLLADEETFSQADLADALGVSQASVSPAVRALINTLYVEKVRLPGVRGDQYRLAVVSFSRLMHETALGLDVMVGHLEKGAELPGPQRSAGRHQLGVMTQVYRQLADLMREAAQRTSTTKEA